MQESKEKLQVVLEHKSVKNYTIRIKNDGTVHVTIPKNGTEEQAIDFVKRKADWIMKKRAILLNKKVLPFDDLQFDYFDEIALRDTVGDVFGKFYSCGYKIPYPTLSFRKMKRRWGSCEKENHKITLNKMLKDVSESCQEYVVSHELAHLVEANHSKDFYEVLSDIMPDYKKREEELKGYVIR